MTEDEEFHVMEQRRRLEDYIKQAKLEGEKFVDSYGDRLGDMTLRQAFEIGFRYGLTSERRL